MHEGKGKQTSLPLHEALTQMFSLSLLGEQQIYERNIECAEQQRRRPLYVSHMRPEEEAEYFVSCIWAAVSLGSGPSD